MNKNEKSVHACYQDIRMREMQEFDMAMRKYGRDISFNMKDAPVIVADFGDHAAHVLITGIVLDNNGVDTRPRIYGREQAISGCAAWYEEEKEILFRDILNEGFYELTSFIPEPKVMCAEEHADRLTNMVMHEIYGEEFDSKDDITEDDDMSDNWDRINDVLYGILANL